MQPIGVVKNSRDEPIDDGWDQVDSYIELDLSVVDVEATQGLLEFSHVEVVFLFDHVDVTSIERGARFPRNNHSWPEVGILAQRAKHRPNRIGTTVVELMAVRPSGRIEVRGLDAIDGTPVLDIKPYFREFAPRGDVRQPTWASELMRQYWRTDAERPERLDDATAAKWLAEVQRSPADRGTLELIVRRPQTDGREVIEAGELDVELGLVGDNWLARGSSSRLDGLAEPLAQLNIMNSRCAALVAGDVSRVALAGDQLFVDFDLSPANVPPGTRLSIGSAVIEITAKPHTGCAKFTRRFGLAAHRWINGRDGRANNFRGVCAMVITPGAIRQGDLITKVSPPY